MTGDRHATVTRIVYADRLAAEAVRATLDGEQVVVVRAGLPKGPAREAVSRVLHPGRIPAGQAAVPAAAVAAGGGAVSQATATLPLPAWQEDAQPAGLRAVRAAPRTRWLAAPGPLALAVILLLAVAVPSLIASARVFATAKVTAIRLEPARQPVPRDLSAVYTARHRRRSRRQT